MKIPFWNVISYAKFAQLSWKIKLFYGCERYYFWFLWDKKCIMNIGFKVSSKNGKMAKNQKWQNCIFCHFFVLFFVSMGQNLLGKTIKSRKDHFKEPFLTSEKKLNIENMKVRIGLI